MLVTGEAGLFVDTQWEDRILVVAAEVGNGLLKPLLAGPVVTIGALQTVASVQADQQVLVLEGVRVALEEMAIGAGLRLGLAPVVVPDQIGAHQHNRDDDQQDSTDDLDYSQHR
jgi:hypothetical protein